MKVLGITGGVGVGKSMVLGYLARKHQARVLEADKIAHALMEPGEICYERIVDCFGRKILGEDGVICRGRLGKIVFSNQEKLHLLNGIVHPAVKSFIRAEIEKEKKAQRAPFAAIEAALLLEDGYDEICDEIWYIHADEEVRIQRLILSRGYTRERAEQIMKNQLSEEAFRKRCQFVVDNSTDIVENTYEQIDRGLREHEFL